MFSWLTLAGSGTDSGNYSPVTKQVDQKTADFHIPQLPSFAESPSSTPASTPADEQPRLGHRRTDSVTIEGEDYFLSLAKYANGGSKSMPGTPHSLAARNITFSPTIQLHDTWGCLEYDRRGDIATCIRLTPMLAQQIKEELNTFKMVSCPAHMLCVITRLMATGNGGPRNVEGLHPLLLMDIYRATPGCENHYAPDWGKSWNESYSVDLLERYSCTLVRTTHLPREASNMKVSDQCQRHLILSITSLAQGSIYLHGPSWSRISKT